MVCANANNNTYCQRLSEEETEREREKRTATQLYKLFDPILYYIYVHVYK